MRVVYPERINKMCDLVAPYMEYKERVGFVLKKEAPLHIVKMYKEILEWDYKNATRKM